MPSGKRSKHYEVKLYAPKSPETLPSERRSMPLSSDCVWRGAGRLPKAIWFRKPLWPSTFHRRVHRMRTQARLFD